ncbi:zinc finger MYM-type protein 5-like [Aphis craccivora]|uniref:Zinc finger MYM-type protein 5-like n=1 Tax=Aphis craccivora TaxID=307492 RepID=A0A6G0VUN1_APHCR|nr:zinc finger MYM-type protein 5-like [Aphis craccivora]
MSSSPSEELCLCGKVRSTLNYVNWQRHIKSCSFRKIKKNNSSIESFFSSKPVLTFNDNELNVEPKNSDGHTSRVFDVISNVNMSNDATALAELFLI